MIMISEEALDLGSGRVPLSSSASMSVEIVEFGTAIAGSTQIGDSTSSTHLTVSSSFSTHSEATSSSLSCRSCGRGQGSRETFVVDFRYRSQFKIEIERVSTQKMGSSEELVGVLATLRASPISMDDIRRCRRVHTQDKICVNSIAKELDIPVEVVTAACWNPRGAATAYSIFVSEIRSSIEAEGWGDTLKQAALRWRELDPEMRMFYDEQAKVGAKERRKVSVLLCAGA